MRAISVFAADRSHRRLSLVFAVFLCAFPCFLPSRAAAQDAPIALAEGRVVVCVAKDGMVIASVDAHNKAGAPMPVITQTGALRLVVLMGAVQWAQPDAPDKPVRLDRELSALLNAAVDTSGKPKFTDAASDIEILGVALLERVRQVAEQIHQKINLGKDEPVLRLVLADYIPNYGPEVWTLDYRLEQEALGNDYYETHVARPAYNQLYPPEKGEPHTLVEARFPVGARTAESPDLIDLLRQDDPRLAPLRDANDLITQSVSLVVDGESQKSKAAPDADFLRGAIPAVTSQDARQTMALIDYDTGFHWLIQPPAAERAPTNPNQKQDLGAPTLRRKGD